MEEGILALAYEKKNMATARGDTARRQEVPFERQPPLAMSNIDLTNKLNLLTEEVKSLKLNMRERRISNLDTISSTITGEQIYGSIMIIPQNTREKTSHLLPLCRDVFKSRVEKSFEVDIRNDSDYEIEIKTNGQTATVNGSGVIDAHSGSRWYLSVRNGNYSLVRLM